MPPTAPALPSDLEVVRVAGELTVLRTRGWAIPLEDLDESDLAEILADVAGAREQLDGLVERAAASARRAPAPDPRTPASGDPAAPDLLQIGLRDRAEIVVLGGAGTEVRLAEERLREHRWRVVHHAGAPALPATGLAAYLYPSRPRWTTSLPAAIYPATAADAGDVRLVVCAAPDAAYGEIFAAIAAYGRFGIPVLPVTFSAAGATVGPLVVGGNMTGFIQSRFGPSPQFFAEDALRDLALFSTGSAAALEPGGWDAVRAEIDRHAFEVTAADMARYVRISPSGDRARYMLSLRDIARARRLQGELWSIASFLALDDLAPDEWSRAGAQLTDGALVAIKDAFVPEFAAAVYAALDRHDAWTLHETIAAGFYFHGHVVYDFEQLGPCLSLLHMICDSEATIRWASTLSGVPCTARATAFPSWYMPGDQTTIHDDRVQDRVLAFIWHLSRDWHPAWGGDLVWCTTGEIIAPSFNTLYLMAVRHGQPHTVMPVSPMAQGKRLCWNGWWKSEERVAPVGGQPRSRNIELGGGRIVVRPLLR